MDSFTDIHLYDLLLFFNCINRIIIYLLFFTCFSFNSMTLKIFMSVYINLPSSFKLLGNIPYYGWNRMISNQVFTDENCLECSPFHTVLWCTFVWTPSFRMRKCFSLIILEYNCEKYYWIFFPNAVLTYITTNSVLVCLFLRFLPVMYIVNT